MGVFERPVQSIYVVRRQIYHPADRRFFQWPFAQPQRLVNNTFYIFNNDKRTGALEPKDFVERL